MDTDLIFPDMGVDPVSNENANINKITNRGGYSHFDIVLIQTSLPISVQKIMLKTAMSDSPSILISFYYEGQRLKGEFLIPKYGNYIHLTSSGKIDVEK